MGRLTRARQPLRWREAKLLAARDETPTARTLLFDVPGWPGHLPGQHVDVRLTAEDGYQAQRSYSIASAPDGSRLELTVQRLDDGEVSPYLTEELRPGDAVELRGPIGGWFVWQPDAEPPPASPAHPAGASGGPRGPSGSSPVSRRRVTPVLLLAGGSGVVPLMAMVRTRVALGSRTPMRLIYSTRSPDTALYRDELRELAARHDPDLGVELVYTRSAPPGWSWPVGRLDAARLAALAWPPSAAPACFVCGPTGFVEAVAKLLVDQGHDPGRIKTERFGPSAA